MRLYRNMAIIVCSLISLLSHTSSSRNQGPVLTASYRDCYMCYLSTLNKQERMVLATLTISTQNALQTVATSDKNCSIPTPKKSCHLPTLKKNHDADESDVDSNGTASCVSSPEPEPVVSNFSLTRKDSYWCGYRSISPSTSHDSLHGELHSPLASGRGFGDCPVPTPKRTHPVPTPSPIKK